MSSRRPPSHSQWWVSQLPSTDASEYVRLVGAADRRDERARRVASENLAFQVTEAHVPDLLDILSVSIAAEDLGGIAVENLLRIDDLSRPMKARLVRAAWDEVRHAAIFEGLAESLEVAFDRQRSESTAVAAATKLSSQLAVPTTDIEFAFVHTILEALALEFFAIVARCGHSPKIKSSYRVVEADESTHVALGLDLLDYLSKDRPTISERRRVDLLEGCIELTPLAQPERMARRLEPFGAELPRRFLDREHRRDRLLKRVGARLG